MMNLEGMRVLIAGGTGNVGRYLVRGVLAAGATVIVPSRSQEKLGELERQLEREHRARFVPLVGDITDAKDGERLVDTVERLDGAIASLGRFQAVPAVLESSRAALEAVVEDYLLAHFSAARLLIPLLRERGGGYVTINGPLAFEPRLPGSALVSIATAAQAMLARVLSEETAGTTVRVNELVLYSGFGWGTEAQNSVTGEEIGRFAAYLLSDLGAGVRGETIHLRSRAALPPMAHLP